MWPGELNHRRDPHEMVLNYHRLCTFVCYQFSVWCTGETSREADEEPHLNVAIG